MDGDHAGWGTGGPMGIAANRIVRVATLALPRGVSRERYRREFTAEMFGQTQARQLSNAVSVCGHMWSLRSVIVHGSDTPRISFLCRSNLRHHWIGQANEEGPPFAGCSRCGREKGDVTNASINSLFLPMGSGSPRDY